MSEQKLDRYIAGNYGGDQLAGEDEKSDAVDFWESEQGITEAETEARLDQLDEMNTRKALDAMAREGMVSPETTCIDCGQPTTLGKGSARCSACWEDRCGTPAVLGECDTKRRAHARTERCVNWRAYSHYR